jgi:nitrate/nitrite transport system permease protein
VKRDSYLTLQASLLSLLLLAIFLGVWHLATLQPAVVAGPALTAEQAEYEKLLGKAPGTKKSDGFPTLAQMGQTMRKHLADPFFDNGPNDKGIAIQLGHSLLRVGLGFGVAALVAIPLGFLIGMSRRLRGCRLRCTRSRTRRSPACSSSSSARSGPC